MPVTRAHQRRADVREGRSPAAAERAPGTVQDARAHAGGAGGREGRRVRPVRPADRHVFGDREGSQSPEVNASALNRLESSTAVRSTNPRTLWTNEGGRVMPLESPLKRGSPRRTIYVDSCICVPGPGLDAALGSRFSHRICLRTRPSEQIKHR